MNFVLLKDRIKVYFCADKKTKFRSISCRKMSKDQQEDRKDPYDGEYIGNIWGWRNSFIGLGIILFMLGVLGIRAWTMEPLPVEEQGVEMINSSDAEVPTDTIATPQKDTE